MKSTKHLCHLALLAVVFVVVGSFSLQAQDDLLDRPVRLKIKHKRLGKVMDQMEKDGNLLFSYDSRIVPKDRLITLTITESTLQEALALLLGDGYDFREAGNYIIVRKKAVARRLAQKSPTVPLTKISSDPRPKKTGLQRPDSPELEASKQVMRNIIGDLVKEKVVGDKDSLHWFGLDEGQFIVNGKAMPDSLHTTFKSRYLKPDGVGYYFGPVKVTGRGVFFDKNDLQ